MTENQSGIDFSQSNVAYEEQPLGPDVAMLVNIRQIDVQALKDASLKPQHPNIELPENNDHLEIIELLQKHDPSKTAEILIKRADDKSDSVQTNERIDRNTIEGLFEAYEVGISDTIVETKNATYSAIADLEIHEDSKQKLIACLENIQIDITSVGTRVFRIDIDSFRITIDAVQVFAEAFFLSSIMKTQLSQNILKTVLAGSVAHELGHIINYLPYSGVAPIQCSNNIDTANESSYPVKYENEQEAWTDDWQERFAEYFEIEIIKKLGLSLEADRDLRKIYLSLMLPLLEHVTPKQLAQLNIEIRKKTDANHPARRYAQMARNALFGSHITHLFPFNKGQISKSIEISFAQVNN